MKFQLHQSTSYTILIITSLLKLCAQWMCWIHQARTGIFGHQSCHYANDLQQLPDICQPEWPTRLTIIPRYQTLLLYPGREIITTSNSANQHKAPTPALLQEQLYQLGALNDTWSELSSTPDSASIVPQLPVASHYLLVGGLSRSPCCTNLNSNCDNLLCLTLCLWWWWVTTACGSQTQTT